MARFKACKDVNFGITGRMRDIVFRQTKLGIIAAQYNKPPYSETKANSVVAKTFGAISRLGLDLKPMVNVGLIDLAANTFTVNSQFVKANFKHGSVGTDGLVTIDYPEIVVAVGAGKMLVKGKVEQSAMGGVEFTWDKNKFGADETKTMLYAAVFCPDAERNMEAMSAFSLGEAACSMGTKEVALPASWISKKVYCYAFTRDANGVTSRSQYMGSVDLA